MMNWAGCSLFVVLLASPIVGQTAGEPALTEDGLRAWLVSGGAIEANTRLIHEQFGKQRQQLPPWWPKAIADQEEEALVSVDLVTYALPHYKGCMSDREARILAKLALTSAGKRVASSAIETHEKAVVAGASAEGAQAAGQAAAAKTTDKLSNKDVKEVASAFTPAETTYAAKHFTPARVAQFKSCAATAFADTSKDMAVQQEAAINAVIEKNRPALVDAKTAYVKDHPDYKDQ